MDTNTSNNYDFDVEQETHAYNLFLEEEMARRTERARQAERVYCPCGGYYRLDGQRRHNNTLRHLRYMNSL